MCRMRRVKVRKLWKEFSFLLIVVCCFRKSTYFHSEFYEICHWKLSWKFFFQVFALIVSVFLVLMLIGIHQLIPILMIPWIVASILKIMSLNLLLIFMITEHEKHHFRNLTIWHSLLFTLFLKDIVSSSFSICSNTFMTKSLPTCSLPSALAF